MSDIKERLREPIIADAHARGDITSMALSERLIRERIDAAGRIDELEKVCRQIEEWWLESGQHIVGGAPYCMFALRAALNNNWGEKDHGGPYNSIIETAREWCAERAALEGKTNE